MTDTGHCKHGDFLLTQGCPHCVAERQAEEAAARGEEAPGPAAELAPETALELRPGEDVEVHGYFEEALKLLDYAEARVITTDKDATLAAEDLSLIANLKKAMESKRKEYLEPLKAQTEAIRATYTLLMDPVLAADRITRDKLLGYQKEQERIRLQKEDINRKRIEAAEQEARLNGTGEITESVGLVEVGPEASKAVHSQLGTAGQRENWKYEVVDFSQLPDEYKVADTAMLNSIAKRHHDQKQIPGVRFYNDPVLAVRTR